MCIKYIYICIYSHVEYHKLRTTVSTRLVAESSLEACSTPHHVKGWTAQHHQQPVSHHIDCFNDITENKSNPATKVCLQKGADTYTVACSPAGTHHPAKPTL